MGLASIVSKLAFCQRISRTPSTFLRLAVHSSAAGRCGLHPTKAQKTVQADYLLNLANAPKPTTLRTYAGDLNILYEIFWQQSYNVSQLRAGTFRTVLDVGANVGLAALYFLHKFPTAQLICLEPEPANFRLLQHNLRGTSAFVLQAALSATDGIVKIDSSRQAYNAKVSAETGTIEVSAICMLTLLQSQNLDWVDLLKIDIEDYEQQVFGQPANWLRQVGILLIEIHSAASYAAVHSAAQAQGFTWEQVAGKQTNSGLFVARNPQVITK